MAKKKNRPGNAQNTAKSGAGLSSIHIQKANGNCLKHNAREEEHQAKTINEEFSHNNICEIGSDEAQKNFDKLYEERIAKNEANRKADKKNCMVEAVLNIEPDTTKEQLKAVSDYIEQEFNFKLIQTATHKDEGHKKDDNLKINYHSHMVFLTLDEDGKQMNRREHISRDKLSKLQDFTAEALEMERGQIDSKTERLAHKDFKEHKRRTEPLEKKIKFLENRHDKILEIAQEIDDSNNKEISNLKELQKQLKIDLKTQKEENKHLRYELQENDGIRGDFARLEQENRDEIERIKERYEIEIEQLKEDNESLDFFKETCQEQQQELDQYRAIEKSQSKDVGMSM